MRTKRSKVSKLIIIWHSLSDSKMHFRWLAFKNVCLLHPWLKFRKNSILLASSSSFNVKNDNIHTFFSLFWFQILNLPASLQNKNTRIGPFPSKILTEKEPINRDLLKNGFAI